MSEYLTTREAAALCGFTPAAFNMRRIRGNGPPYTKMGHRTVRYKRDDVLAWLAEAKPEPARKVGTKHPSADPDPAIVDRLAIFQNEIDAATRIQDAEVRAAAVRVAGLRFARMLSELFALQAEGGAP